MDEQNLGRGARLHGFGSSEEMFAFMAEQEAAAIADALPEQWEITWGDDVIRFVDDLVIFGHIYTEREFLGENITGKPEDDEEIMYELDGLRDAHTRGYRYGQWFSAVLPEGEHGSAHVVSLWKLRTGDLAYARALGWQTWPLLVIQIASETADAQHRNTNHEGDAP